MPAMVQHEDFGEKIGGAKKDLWSQRGLRSDDLKQMNSREADKHVKKDNIWKKADYQKMIDSGIPFDVVYFIKTVRDNINAMPLYLKGDDTGEKRAERQKQYIDTVRELYDIVENVKTKDSALSVFKSFLLDKGYVCETFQGMRSTGYAFTEKGKNNPVITSKLLQALNMTDERYDREIISKAKLEQFDVPKENRIPNGYSIRYNNGEYTYSSKGDWKPNTYFVSQKHSILEINFETREEALRWVQDYAKNKITDKKRRFVPEQLAHVHRDGTDYRLGRNVEGQDYLDTFGFRGGQYGNWMNQIDRQGSLNYGYDALKDLAAALCISDKDISYGGHLSIAFGARGSGKFVAHYEPMRQVINLTKMRGAGSLAHEWFHGLDDYLGTKMSVNGYLSDNPSKFPLFSQLIETMKYKPETPEQAIKRAELSLESNKLSAGKYLASTVSRYIEKGSEQDKSEYESLKEAFLRGEPGSVEKISALKKKITGRIIPKEERGYLQMYESMIRSILADKEPVIRKVTTDYLRDSREMSHVYLKDGNYWDSNVEMTARAFATYIMDKLPGRSDYLVGHAECAVGLSMDNSGETRIVKAYPQGEERKAINEVFDKIVAELKHLNYLTHEDRTTTLHQNEPENRDNLFEDYRECTDYTLSMGESFGSSTGEQISLDDYDQDYDDFHTGWEEDEEEDEDYDR